MTLFKLTHKKSKRSFYEDRLGIKRKVYALLSCTDANPDDLELRLVGYRGRSRDVQYELDKIVDECIALGV